MATPKEETLEEVLRKLEEAEKEYAERLKNSRLEAFIQNEEKQTQEHSY